jgi:hypothetical protein
MRLASGRGDYIRDDAATRFELERLAFLTARHHGRIREMVAVSASLRRLASSPRSNSIAALAQAEAAICSGRIEQAERFLEHFASINASRRNTVQAAIEAMLRADIALYRGDASLANRLATAAYAILDGRHLEARKCAVAVSRSRSALNNQWDYAGFVTELGPRSYDYLALECERARHLLKAGAAAQAERGARLVLETATELGFEGVAARSSAVLAACRAVRSQVSESYENQLNAALRGLLSSGDWSLAVDIFDLPLQRREFGPFEIDEALLDILYDRLVLAVPQMTTDGAGAIEATRAFLEAAIAGAAGNANGLQSTTAALHSSGAALLHYFKGAQNDVTNFIELAAFAAMPALRNGLRERIDALLRPLATAPTVGHRTFSIDISGPPKYSDTIRGSVEHSMEQAQSSVG